MNRPLMYTIAGGFIGTILSLFLSNYRTNPFLLFLIPMWGMVLGVSLARVVGLYKEPNDISAGKLPNKVLKEN